MIIWFLVKYGYKMQTWDILNVVIYCMQIVNRGKWSELKGESENIAC